MSFKDIKGQDRAISFLKGSMASGRISHAYIFYGPGGVGKKLAALNFAKAANCLGADADGCDACASCKKIDSSNHPDVLLLKPEEEGGAIGIDDVRALIKDASLKPYEARKKFYIIDDADRMKEEAQNAILKTLEEPPSDSVLILIAESPGRLRSTITSRCQAVKFFALGAEDVKEILVKKHGVDAAKAHILSCLASGRPGEALRYKDEEFFARRDRVVTALANGTFFESDFDKLSKADLKAYLNILLTWYRDILIAKTGLDGGPEVMNIDRKDAVMAEAANIGFDRLYDIIRQVVSTSYFVEQNANPKLAMAALALSI